MRSGEVAPDMGPALPHKTAGATLVTARPPLAAFNVELQTADHAIAQRVAAQVREAGGGLPGVRAIGLPLERGPLSGLDERARPALGARSRRSSPPSATSPPPRAPTRPRPSSSA